MFCSVCPQIRYVIKIVYSVRIRTPFPVQNVPTKRNRCVEVKALSAQSKLFRGFQERELLAALAHRLVVLRAYGCPRQLRIFGLESTKMCTITFRISANLSQNHMEFALCPAWDASRLRGEIRAFSPAARFPGGERFWLPQ